MNRRNFMKNTLIIAPLSVLSANNKKRRKISFKGKITINGKIVKNINDIKVDANSRVKVEGEGSFVQFKITDDAFKISNHSDVQFNGKKNVENIEVKIGRLLSAFKKGRKRKIITMNATMGIRGTAVFVEAKSSKVTNFCTCYGKTIASDTSNKNSTRELEATHHSTVQITDGKVENANIFYGLSQYLYNPTHTDRELRDLEAMVGRIPAFDKDGKKPLIAL